jgi:hypothetical protein
MTKPKLFTESEATGLLDRLAPDWPLLLCDGVVIDHVLKVIATGRPYRGTQRHRACAASSISQARSRKAEDDHYPASAHPESGSDQRKRLT